MIREMRLLIAVALTIVVTMPAIAEENFGLLKAKQIRAQVGGGTQRTGIWEIQGDKLCKSKAKTNPLTCYEVWMSGNNISLRLNKGDTHFIGVVEKHGAN